MSNCISTTVISVISTIYMVEILRSFNSEENCFFRVEGGDIFGIGGGCPERGAFAHVRANKIIPYLEWNGWHDLEQGGQAHCGYVCILYSEKAVSPTPEMKSGHKKIDEGEVVIFDYFILWESPIIRLALNSVKSQIKWNIWFDWGALFQIE